MTTGRGFRKLEEHEAFKGDRISVGRARFEAPDGRTFERDVVHHPGAVAIVPLVDDGNAALLVRQYRAPLDALVLEIPAGLRDKDGEAPEDTARRELVEEVGMRAGRIERLCVFHNSPGFCDEQVYLFLGLDLEPAEHGQDLQGVEESHLTVERIALDDVPRLIHDGRLTDAKTIVGLALAREALQG